MPILPFIDLLLLAGWTALFGGFILKFIYLTTTYRPTFFGLTPIDFLMVAAIFLLFSLTLSARTWVKAHEARQAEARRRANDEIDQRIEMLDGARRAGAERAAAATATASAADADARVG